MGYRHKQFDIKTTTNPSQSVAKFKQANHGSIMAKTFIQPDIKSAPHLAAITSSSKPSSISN